RGCGFRRIVAHALTPISIRTPPAAYSIAPTPQKREGRESRPSLNFSVDFLSAAAHPPGVRHRPDAAPCASAAAHVASPCVASAAYDALPSAASAHRSPDVFPPADVPYPVAAA